MKTFPFVLFLFFAALEFANSPAETLVTKSPAETSAPSADNGRVASLAPADLREYASLSPEVQQLLSKALALTTRNLTYKYGSSDPKEGGMDCSGTIYYLLNDAGLKDVPRDAFGMYQWVWNSGHFHAVNGSSLDSFEFAQLKPGDLLFWTGTYDVKRDPPVSHVMIYLGINRHSGKQVMVGASDRRVFEGKSRYGVSVFDFTLPRKEKSGDGASGTKSRFIGYGAIPGLTDAGKLENPRK